MKTSFVSPSFDADAFNCPQCGSFAHQTWGSVLWHSEGETEESLADWRMSLCQHCKRFALWHQGILVFPTRGLVEPPHADMPDDIRGDYVEAAEIVVRSPRGACALLRLCIQKLCRHVGAKSSDINGAISELVKAGLTTQVQQALDIVRVIGNEAVHPGALDLRDDVDTASALFALVNYIVDDRVSRPRKLDELFSKIPAEKREAIKRRDG